MRVTLQTQSGRAVGAAFILLSGENGWCIQRGLASIQAFVRSITGLEFTDWAIDSGPGITKGIRNLVQIDPEEEWELEVNAGEIDYGWIRDTTHTIKDDLPKLHKKHPMVDTSQYGPFVNRYQRLLKFPPEWFPFAWQCLRKFYKDIKEDEWIALIERHLIDPTHSGA